MVSLLFLFLHVAPGKRAVTEKDLPKDGVVASLRAFPTGEDDFGCETPNTMTV